MTTNHILISGPSASGKTTLIKKILSLYPSLSFSVSHTTRPMRRGEMDGRDYHFVSEDSFKKLIEEQRILEYTVFNGNFYGTALSELDSEGKVFDLEYRGVMHFKTHFPSSTFIFIDCDRETVRKRLQDRGDREEDTRERLKLYDKFQGIKGLFNKVVMNNRSLEDALREIVEYLESKGIVEKRG